MRRAPWREWTLVHLLRRQAAEQGDRPFVRFEDGQAFPLPQFDIGPDLLQCRIVDERTHDAARFLRRADTHALNGFDEPPGQFIYDVGRNDQP